jgi:hypothetical protein
MTIDEARSILAEVLKPNGNLSPYTPQPPQLDYDPTAYGWGYMDYTVGASDCTLDGEYSADQLEAIAVYMRHVAAGGLG